ncbi:unnamed protein product [Linum tenue]|uniref:Uncharacterized protein n=1 Tax=Linum tenue TaxID=586396 RepID=A0AAV0LGE8_9ROSI|nr:unnamed protein product [Linum tenue]CAI0432647.1 unnamed protein product [Linum tenue]
MLSIFSASSFMLLVSRILMQLFVSSDI